MVDLGKYGICTCHKCQETYMWWLVLDMVLLLLAFIYPQGNPILVGMDFLDATYMKAWESNIWPK